VDFGSQCASFDPKHPERGYEPAIPEPFWYRSWRTWFRDRPACYQCAVNGEPLLFKNRQEWDNHYVLTHLEFLPDVVREEL
jgi:hypothetical protein